MEKLGKAMDAELRLGHGSEPDTTQGPLINARAAEKVKLQLYFTAAGPVMVRDLALEKDV